MKCLRLIPIVLWALASAAQTGKGAPLTAQEFPAMLAEPIEAGKTPVGTSVSAHLAISTLAGGEVIPEGAVLSGVVEQSSVKSGTLSTRLKIHMTQAAWKDHTMPLNLYLTDQYYPKVASRGAEPSDFDASNSRMRGVDVRSVNNVGHGGVSANTIVVNTPPRATLQGATEAAENGNRRAAMSGFSGRVKQQGISAVLDGAGGVAVISDAKKLKLDRTTCYSFESVVPVPQPGLHASKQQDPQAPQK